MKVFWVEAAELSKVLRALAPYAAPKSVVQALSMVRFSWENESLTLACTDLDRWAQVRIRVEGVGSGSFCLPQRLLAGIAARLEGLVEFAPSDGVVNVTAGKVEFHLNALGGDDFPMLPAPKQLLGECDSGVLRRAFSRVAFCCAQDSSRPALTGLYWEDEVAVATDGTRIAVCGGLPDLGVALLLDGKGVAELADMMPDNTSVRIWEAGYEATASTRESGLNAVRFEWSDEGCEYVVGVRLLNAPFPQWRTVIPGSEPMVRIRVSRDELAEAVRRVSVIGRDGDFPVVEFEARDDVLAVRASGSAGEGLEEIPVESIEGSRLSWRANARIVLDGLKAAQGETLALSGWGEEAIQLMEDGTGWWYYWLPLRR